jgi:hypothetical protein
MTSAIYQSPAPSEDRPHVKARWFVRTNLVFLVIVFVTLTTFFRSYSTDVAGGSDSYGYVSQAHQLINGQVYSPENVLSSFGLPENSGQSHPLGYRPHGSDGIVPTYPFGYPLLLALAIAIGGPQAAYWVTSLLASGTILITYFLGKSLAGREAGIIAATLTFLLPNFLWSSFNPMSDVPATFVATLALLMLIGSRPGQPLADVVLGFAVGFGIWQRPNMILLVIPVLCWLIWQRDLSRLFRFGASVMPFFVVSGVANTYLYGAPWSSGYGSLPLAPTLADAAARAFRHLLRLHDQQAGVGLVLLVCGLAFGRMELAHRVILASVGGLLLIFFAFYAIDDAWWYGRFLLPALPAIAVIEASAVVRLLDIGRGQLLGRVTTGLLGVVFAWASLGYAVENGVFTQWVGESRYPAAARLARDNVQSPALVLAMQHSGSLRHYGALPTIRYDEMPTARLLETLQQVSQAGGSLYFLGDGWELERLKTSDRSMLLAGSMKVGQIEPGQVVLLHLSPRNMIGDSLPQNQTNASFASQFTAIGYDLSSRQMRPGDQITVTIHWQALVKPDVDFSVFVHLVDEAGKIVGQSDSYPVAGTYPTTWWQPNHVVGDSHTLATPHTLLAGVYRLNAGLYRLDTLERLTVKDATGAEIGNHLSLGSIEVRTR